MISSPPETYVPRGKITWSTPKEPVKEQESYTPKGEITWGGEATKEEAYSPTGDIVWDRPSPQPKQEAPQDDLQSTLVTKLMDREGVKKESYLDSLGKPTGGVGHLLVGEELIKYPVGSEIPQEVVDKWLAVDSKKALEAAKKQALEVGVEDQDFLVALASVNFQLGDNWKEEHEQTWKLMKEGKFKEAADEAANSVWNKQTPTRVEDFQNALRNL